MRDVPERVRSPFGETLSILFVGVVLDAVALFLLALASPRLPPGAPDLQLLIDNPRGYASDGTVASSDQRLRWPPLGHLSAADGRCD